MRERCFFTCSVVLKLPRTVLTFDLVLEIWCLVSFDLQCTISSTTHAALCFVDLFYSSVIDFPLFLLKQLVSLYI